MSGVGDIIRGTSYSNIEQLIYYVVVPLIVFSVVLVVPIVLGVDNSRRHGSNFSLPRGRTISILSLVVMIPYVFFYTGGV